MNAHFKIKGPCVTHHLLIAQDGAHLIDGGFIGGVEATGRALKGQGLTFADLRSVLLTHGHLDHTLNVAELQGRSGCRVYAPKADQEHVEGRHRASGWSRVAGGMEWGGRKLFRYRQPTVDTWFSGGDVIDVCGSLEVVDLPGHTVGHCGFFQREHRLLFAGDLFSSGYRGPQVPPRLFNDDHMEAKGSILAASALPVSGVILNHGGNESPEETLVLLQELASRL